MPYGTTYITTKGAILAAKTLQSKTLKFSKFIIGNGELEDASVEKIKALDNLINPVLNMDITNIVKKEETQVTVSGLFKNTDINESIYLREIGLYAIDLETEEEILFAYINYGDKAEYINNSISEKKELYYDMVITVDNADNIVIEIDPTTIYMIEQEAKGYFTKCKTLILEASSWIQNETSKNYEYNITDSEITAKHLIEGHMDLANQAKMTNGYIESYDGGYKIITSKQPEENISINISMQMTTGGV